MPLISSTNIGQGGGSMGMIIDGNLAATFGQSQSYTVPAGKHIRFTIWANVAGAIVRFDGSTDITLTNAPSQEYNLGPGGTISYVGGASGTLYVRGTIFANG